jgi:hypothetical protein
MQSRSLGALAFVVAACALAAGPAAAAPSWAPASRAAIHPGVQTQTAGAQCTANFVFYDASNVYLGQAAHCSGTGTATETDGCSSGSLPLGTAVDIGGSRPGTLVYNSWLTMQAHGEAGASTCAYNDLALVKVDPADTGAVNPWIPFWGGPTGLDSDGTATGDTVLSYGNSSLRGGTTLLSQAGQEPGRRRRRLDPHGLHRDSGHPRRLWLGVPERGRQGARRAEHGRPRAARGLQRRRRPRQGDRLP